MRKVFLVSILLCIGLANKSYAQTTDISKYENVLYISNVKATAKSQVVLSLQMNNIVEARGFQCDIDLPKGFSFALEDEFPIVELSLARTTAKKTDYFNAVIQQDGCLRLLCNSTSGYSFSGTTGEVATIAVDVADNVQPGTYIVTVKNAKISDPQAQDHSVADNIESSITVDDGQVKYDEGYSVQIAPFEFEEAVSGKIFVAKTPKDITDLSFEIELPEIIGTNQLYALTKGLGNKNYNTTIDDDTEGLVSVSIARIGENVINNNKTLVKLAIEDLDGVVTEGIYVIHVKNIVMTDVDGNEYHGVPYSANIYVGSPKVAVTDGKVTLSGDYSNEDMAQKLLDAIPTDNKNVTAIDLSGVTALPMGKTITVANPNAFIVTKTDLGLTNTKNVIIGKVCEALEIADGEAFAAPANFTATNATYTRDITNLSTICLPYAPSTDNYEYYELAEESAGALRFTRVEIPKANTPYLFKKKGTGNTITGSGVEVTTDGAGETGKGKWNMVGTYGPVVLTASDDAYALSAGKLYHNTGTLTISPFRAYFTCTTSEAKSMDIYLDGEYTGIQMTEEGEFVNRNADTYNMSGQKVDDNYKGIVIRNGIKTLKR